VESAEHGALRCNRAQGGILPGELPLNNSTGAVWMTITNLAVVAIEVPIHGMPRNPSARTLHLPSLGKPGESFVLPSHPAAISATAERKAPFAGR
jgi:hypothetical protein